MSDVELTPAQQTTYIYLGVIAAHAGHQESVYWTLKDIKAGERSPGPLDMGAWFADRVNESEDLKELYKFRNRLFHGVCLVDSQDGSVKIFRDPDRDTKPEYTYSQEELHRWAIRFFFTAFDNHSVKATVSPYLVSIPEGGISDEDGMCAGIHNPDDPRDAACCPKERWVFRPYPGTETPLASLADEAGPCLRCWEQ